MLSFQGGDAAAGAAKVRSAFWPALQMNWRVWTPVQFINVNYVPLQVRLPRQPPPEAISHQPQHNPPPPPRNNLFSGGNSLGTSVHTFFPPGGPGVG